MASLSSQDPDLHHVAAVMKEQAASAADTQSHKTSEIWTCVYGAAALTQARIVQFSDRKDRKEMGDDVKVDIRLVRKQAIGRPAPEAKEVPAGGVGGVKPPARLVRGEPSREHEFNPCSV